MFYLVMENYLSAISLATMFIQKLFSRSYLLAKKMTGILYHNSIHMTYRTIKILIQINFTLSTEKGGKNMTFRIKLFGHSDPNYRSYSLLVMTLINKDNSFHQAVITPHRPV